MTQVLALLFYLVSLLLLRLPDRALATGFEVERASHIPKAPDPKKQKKAVFTDLPESPSPEPPTPDREAA